MSSTAAAASLVAFEKHLRCPICLTLCTDPLTLPCCHSFCGQCITQLINATNAERQRAVSETFHQPARKQGEFDCPVCRAACSHRQTRRDDCIRQVVQIFRQIREAWEDEQGMQLSQDVPLTTHSIPPPNNSPVRSSHPAPIPAASSSSSRKRLRSRDRQHRSQQSSSLRSVIQTPRRGMGRRASSGRRAAAAADDDDDDDDDDADDGDDEDSQMGGEAEEQLEHEAADAEEEKMQDDDDLPPPLEIIAEPAVAGASSSTSSTLYAARSAASASDRLLPRTSLFSSSPATPQAARPLRLLSSNLPRSAPLTSFTSRRSPSSSPHHEQHRRLATSPLRLSSLSSLSAPMRAPSSQSRPRKASRCVLLTSALQPDQLALVKEMVQTVNASTASSSFAPPRVVLVSAFDSSVSHLVTSASLAIRSGRLLHRTNKYFLCLLSGCFVLCVDWVTDCLQQRRLVDEQPFVITGDEKAEDTARRARERRERGEQPLLSGVTVWEAGRWAKEETQREVKKVVEVGGGRWAGRMQDIQPSTATVEHEAERRFLILDDSKKVDAENQRLLTPTFLADCRRLQLRVISTSWLMDCVSRLSLPVYDPSGQQPQPQQLQIQ